MPDPNPSILSMNHRQSLAGVDVSRHDPTVTHVLGCRPGDPLSKQFESFIGDLIDSRADELLSIASVGHARHGRGFVLLQEVNEGSTSAVRVCYATMTSPHPSILEYDPASQAEIGFTDARGSFIRWWQLRPGVAGVLPEESLHQRMVRNAREDAAHREAARKAPDGLLSRPTPTMRTVPD